MIKKLLALVTAVILLAAVLPAAAGARITDRGYTGSYYSDNGYSVDALLAKNGSALKADLAGLMTRTHTHITSYSEIRDLFYGSDADPDTPGNILLCYSGASVNGAWDSGVTYNREHVWPKSLGTFNTSNAGADLHHIRPEDQAVNSARGNRLMGWTDTATSRLSYNGQPIDAWVSSTANTFEPRDGFKGDTARIYFYVAVRWGEDLTGPVSDDTFETLLEWNIIDPVDSLEMARNDYVYSVEGNRNVFIDYPEFGRLVYGSAENGFDYAPLTDGDYTYFVRDGAAVIIGYNGSSAELVLPASIGGYPVAGIGCAAFAGSDTLVSVTIPAGVTQIGPYAFFNCTALQRVYMGSGAKTVERRAFRACPNLTGMYFNGPAPAFTGEGADHINVSGGDFACAPSGFTMYYVDGQSGWTSGRWYSGTAYYNTALWDGSSEPEPTAAPTAEPTSVPDVTPEPTAAPDPTAAPGAGEYKLVTSLDDVTDGDYVLYGVNGSYSGAMSSAIASGHMKAESVTVSGDTVVDPDPSCVWHMERGADGAFTLYNASGNVYCMISTNSTSGFTTDSSASYGYTVTAENASEGSYYLTTTLPGCTRKISIYRTDFRPYNLSDWNKLYLYKFVETETPQPVYHTVRFVDWDGALISEQQVEDGAAAVAPADPVREGYRFTGWSGDFSCVTADITVTALYEAVLTANPGDVNCDGSITASDISALFAYVMNAGSLSQQALLNADLNGDGLVDSTDASLLAQTVFGA